MAAGAVQRLNTARPSAGLRGRDFFSARAGGVAETIGRPLGERRPWLAALLLWAVVFILLGAAIVGLGLLLTHVLLPAGLDRVDSSWSAWFASHRTPLLDDATWVGSSFGSTGVILSVAGVIGVALAVARRWTEFVFLFYAMTLEFGVFLLTTLIVDRHRPGASPLDAAPPTSSYPSGHTASACTLYIGLAIVLTSFIHGTVARVVAWLLAVLVPAAVGLSRVYRGMHYPSDVVAGILLATGALVLALLAVRSLSAARQERARSERRHEDDGADPRPPAVPDAGGAAVKCRRSGTPEEEAWTAASTTSAPRCAARGR